MLIYKLCENMNHMIARKLR